MSILRQPRPQSKPTRRTPHLAAPFGQGILGFWCPTPTMAPGFTPPTSEDDRWAAQTFSATEGWWADSREMEEAAQQAAWEEKWDDLVAAGDACAMCGARGVGTVGGLCDGCNGNLDMDIADEPDAPDADPAIRFAGIASLAERRKA